MRQVSSAGSVRNRRVARARRMGAFVGDSPGSAPFGSEMYGLSRRGTQATRAASGKIPFLRQSAATNLSPRSLFRLPTASALTGTAQAGYYTPMQFLPGLMGGMAMRSKRLVDAVNRNTPGPAMTKQNAYSGGVLGRIMAINEISDIRSNIVKLNREAARGPLSASKQAKLDQLTARRDAVVNRIAKVQSIANPGLNPLVESRGTRLEAQLARSRAYRENIINPATGKPYGGRPAYIKDPRTGATVVGNRARVARSVAGRDAARTAAQGVMEKSAANYANIAANPESAIAKTMTIGKLTNIVSSYYLGAIDWAEMTGSQQALTKKIFRGIYGQGKAKGQFAALFPEMTAGGKYTGSMMNRIRGGSKTISLAMDYLKAGTKYKAGGSKAAAAKFAGMGATQIGGALLKPLNILMTGQLIYDLSRGVGKIAAAGANFAKDAIKSMQGSINKPLFGTGFVDNEVSSSSRARGVMAIQNSRLNARSLLGSEASMMAAHFG